MSEREGSVLPCGNRGVGHCFRWFVVTVATFGVILFTVVALGGAYGPSEGWRPPRDDSLRLRFLSRSVGTGSGG